MVESPTPKPKSKRKLWKQPTTKEKRQKIVENQALHKMPKGFNLAKCWKINNVMAKDYHDYFPFGIEVVKGVEILVQKFILAPSRIQSWPLCYKHKIKIKAKFMSYHKHQHIWWTLKILTRSIQQNQWIRMRLKTTSFSLLVASI